MLLVAGVGADRQHEGLVGQLMALGDACAFAGKSHFAGVQVLLVIEAGAAIGKQADGADIRQRRVAWQRCA